MNTGLDRMRLLGVNMTLLLPALTFTSLALATQFGPRPPMVPLAFHNPHFGLWPLVDRLDGAATRHWTDKILRLEGLIQADGPILRVIGDQPAAVPALGLLTVQHEDFQALTIHKEETQG